MPRLPRKPTAPRPHGAVGAVAATLARRRAARTPRVLVGDGSRQPRALPPDDPAAKALLAAAERLISASQRGSSG